MQLFVDILKIIDKNHSFCISINICIELPVKPYLFKRGLCSNSNHQGNNTKLWKGNEKSTFFF